MKTKLFIAIGVSALACLGLISCGGGDGYGNSGSPTSGQTQTLDTEQVLALAQQRSDISEPFPVNNGATVITPPDDQTAEPISINGT